MPRSRPSSLVLLGLVGALACGRSPFEADGGIGGDAAGDDVEGSAADTGPDEGSAESPQTPDGADTTQSADTGDRPPPVTCPDGEVFADGFENGVGPWDLHPRWSVVQEPEAFEGDAVLWGYWSEPGVGCPVVATAALMMSLDLSTATSATLHFEQIGEACEFDTLWVRVSEQTGPVSMLPEPIPAGDRWTHYSADLTPWVGRSSVQLVLGFDNICGDPCGVSWQIDALRVCTEG